MTLGTSPNTVTAVAQLVLKRGMSASGMHEALAAGWMPAALAVASNVWVVAGLALYFVGALIWLVVLNRVAVSFAYPFVGLGFVLTALLAWALLGEGLTAYRALGCGPTASAVRTPLFAVNVQ